jgi:hypothetical protein
VRFLLAAGRALLADDMGLGETVQALAACELMRLRGEATRILVVTSASLKDQWAREIKRYARSEAVVVSGSAASRRLALSSDAPYKILNDEITWRELTALKGLDADVLILDEAQRAKNFRTKTAATLKAIPSRFLFVLTGTPVENRLDDLYALLQLADPDVLGPLWRFNLKLHQQNERGRVEGYKSLAALRETIAPLVLRRRKEEVLTQLPALTEQTRYLALSDEQAEHEAGLRHDAARLMAITEYGALTPDEQKRLMALRLKARQACNAVSLCDPGREDKGSPKLDGFESLVGEIVAQGTSKILVFSEWREMLKLAAARLDAIGAGYAVLHGGVASDRRPALLERFRESPVVRVLLSTDAGGTGLNLQVASYVIHLDLPSYLCAESGIERGIEGTLAGKRAVRGAALDALSDADTLVAPSFSMFILGDERRAQGPGGRRRRPRTRAGAAARRHHGAGAGGGGGGGRPSPPDPLSRTGFTSGHISRNGLNSSLLRGAEAVRRRWVSGGGRRTEKPQGRKGAQGSRKDEVPARAAREVAGRWRAAGRTTPAERTGASEPSHLRLPCDL